MNGRETCRGRGVNALRLQQPMVVVRQNTPRINLGTQLTRNPQQLILTLSHSLGSLSDDVCMVVAGSGYQVLKIILKVEMG
jgi:hypothetical protein